MYVKIQEITMQNAKNNTVRFELYEFDGTAPDPMPKFDVFGYKLRFNLSRFGFGVLNTSLTLDMVDRDNVLYNKFYNLLRDDIGVRIAINDKEIFWGFPDFEQLERKLFEPGSSRLRVKFYNPIQWLQNIGYDTPDIYAALASTVERDGSGIPSPDPDLVRFGRFFQDNIFRTFLQDTFVSTSEWIANTIIDGEIDPVNREFFNAGYFDRRAFFERGLSVGAVFGQVIRPFWLRAGFSIDYQQPALIQMDDNGLQAKEYGERIDYRPFSGGRQAVINQLTEVDNEIPVIEQSKLLRGVDSLDINPYALITYRQEENIDGLTYPDIEIEEGNATIRNPDVPDPFGFDSFTSTPTPFDARETANLPQRLRVISQSGTDGVLARPNRFIVPTLDEYTDLGDNFAYDHMAALCYLHMQWRQPKREQIRFAYNGILDPMRNHKTDFDGNLYILTRGEWDVINEKTVVTESISVRNENDTPSIGIETEST